MKEKKEMTIKEFAQRGGIARWKGYSKSDRTKALKKAWETRRKNITTQNKVD